MIFYFVYSAVLLQRLAELVLAKENEKWMRERGAFEAGASHYPFMIALHAGFFICLLVETVASNKPLSPIWPFLAFLFILTQVLRVWCLYSLGRFWNTKILILPGAKVVRRGPYAFIKHPNYVIVTIEILLLPLIFQAYVTAAVFTLLNAAMLSVRIPAEEKALKSVTNYQRAFE
ncbi:isoprenylcysteine carboxyl methyltransferase family protein [Jeotgalibacillus proteolyticus]|uniref:Isoprenylcysteine carboxyl methyltransferase n=1 Tax=Jeotgalibacillus proteolyticus TaxID=2082395 RepID=A0A2S5GA00_9BACL|nr:isoprenylcysteine carboxylmethyltransferase family protein [Jeotgalibacillus proteolyticus]PPA69818.1 isoprenylcysteine carboxyl methyltransferase [Jeotgalibacillus proteolyticus]